MARQKTHVRNNTLIFEGCAMNRTGEKTTTSKTTPSTNKLEATEQKGDLLICDLWYNWTSSVHDTRVVNTGTNSNSAKTPEKCLQDPERAKNKIYLEACLQHR